MLHRGNVRVIGLRNFKVNIFNKNVDNDNQDWLLQALEGKQLDGYWKFQ